MTWRALSLAAAILLAGASSVFAQADRYYKTYFQVGFMVRAAKVCNNMAMAGDGYALIKSPEYQRFTDAYPDTVKGWLADGAGAFNSMVMRDGIEPACRAAPGLAR